jgi:hypothetical protein
MNWAFSFIDGARQLKIFRSVLKENATIKRLSTFSGAVLRFCRITPSLLCLSRFVDF